ncbi:hypothetical protein [Dyella koreensis]|uniref:DUF3592 domain-containing protein n=1 Tax=Dyella koreensis TaxID=311235 RepID=A0ABW8K061_9GAMM
MLLISFGALFVSMKRHEWGIAIAVCVIWLLAFAYFSFGFKYKIFWTNEEIRQEASGGNVCVRYEAITKVQLEVANSAEFVSPSRPFRRIAIYAERPSGDADFIDISLKHFYLADVRKMLKSIHLHRPDLVLPKL